MAKDGRFSEVLGPRGGDPHRPRYHLTAPRNWLNDPNGLIRWGDEYHLFYQHNPAGIGIESMRWGHAVSMDLVRWRQLPVALAPGAPYDREGVYSGCAVDDGGVPTAIYTGVHPEVQCLARGSDDLRQWTKHEGNPVIGARPEGLELTGFRDPCVWGRQGRWHMALGSGIKGRGGAVLGYRSENLIDWEYAGPILAGHRGRDALPTGTMWECPNLFPLGDRHVLVISACGGGITPDVLWFVGSYEDGVFIPDEGQPRPADLGGGFFYAPQRLLDGGDRVLLFGWIKEGRSTGAQDAAGWSGVISLPRLLSMGTDGRIGVEVAPEVKMLRGEHRRLEEAELAERDGVVPVEGIGGACLEVDAAFDPGDAEAVGLALRRSPDGREETLLYWERARGRLVFDPGRASLADDADSWRGVRAGPLTLGAEETLRIHAFLDRTVVEVFINGRSCLTGRMYPTRPDSVGLGVFARGGTATLRHMDIWALESAVEPGGTPPG